MTSNTASDSTTDSQISNTAQDGEYEWEWNEISEEWAPNPNPQTTQPGEENEDEWQRQPDPTPGAGVREYTAPRGQLAIETRASSPTEAHAKAHAASARYREWRDADGTPNDE